MDMTKTKISEDKFIIENTLLIRIMEIWQCTYFQRQEKTCFK